MAVIKFCVFLVVLLQVRSTDANSDNYLDVAAFNVRVFGKTKMADPTVREYLPKIILRYDLILIQEIRDSSEEAIQTLLSMVKSHDSRYEMVVSARLGRSTSKEQYAYIYRSDWLTPETAYVYNDVKEDFEREPYVVHFKSSLAAVSDFITIGIHTTPSDAGPEISKLANVYEDAVKRLNVPNVILMGDFNAGCTYVKSFSDIALANDTRFYWLFNNLVDTTTSKTNCAYDRVVITGADLLKNVVPDSPTVFYYDEAYVLNDEHMMDISDHYPVEFQILSKYAQRNIIEKNNFEVTDKQINSALVGNYRKIYTMKDRAIELGYKVDMEYTSSGAYLNFHVSDIASSRLKAAELMRKMRNDFPKFISHHQALSVIHWLIKQLKFLQRGHGSFQTMYDYQRTVNKNISLMLSCSLANRLEPKCWFEAQ